MQTKHLALLLMLGISPATAAENVFSHSPLTNPREQLIGAGGIPTVDVLPRQTLKPAELPDHIQPLKTNDPRLTPFVGIWRGQWEGTLDSIFMIVEATDGRVKVFHSWGANAITRDPGMRYVWGMIYDDTMLLPSDRASISLKIQDDGTLFGLYYSPAIHMPSRIILMR